MGFITPERGDDVQVRATGRVGVVVRVSYKGVLVHFHDGDQQYFEPYDLVPHSGPETPPNLPPERAPIRRRGA